MFWDGLEIHYNQAKNFDLELFIKDHPFLSIGGWFIVLGTIGCATFATDIAAASTAVIMPLSAFIGFTLGIAETKYRQPLKHETAKTIIAAGIDITALMDKLSFHHGDWGFLFGGDTKIRESYEINLEKINSYFDDHPNSILASEAREGLLSLHNQYISAAGKVGMLVQEHYNYYFTSDSDTSTAPAKAVEEGTKVMGEGDLKETLKGED